jgi:antitoxin StbD
MIRAKDFLSATDLSKKTSATLDALAKEDTGRLIIMKNNAPKAVLLSMESYEAMEQEIEDLRLTALTLARLDSFDEKKALTHNDIKEKYGV